MSFEKAPRPFQVVQNKATESGVMKIQIGKLELSITTLNGVNEVVVFSESGDQVSETKLTDFNEVVSLFWKLEALDIS
tara:strand:+ start:1627 stop:1860 length:234 start_codon:yes stop_codon:yes gene_type:complete